MYVECIPNVYTFSLCNLWKAFTEDVDLAFGRRLFHSVFDIFLDSTLSLHEHEAP